MSLSPVLSEGVPQQRAAHTRRRQLLERFHAVRSRTLVLTAPLSVEDQCVQAMPDASPTKWHLAHTTWFFEVSVLLPHEDGYLLFDERFLTLFNSYYETLGPRHPRPKRGLLTRPTLDQVWQYRAHVDKAVGALIESVADYDWLQLQRLIEIGLAHEEQHQELILTDALYLMSCNPMEPAVFPERHREPIGSEPMGWMACSGGEYQVGYQGEGFCFDNESPAHRVWLEPFALGSRPVSNREFLEFIEDGGYTHPQWWLSDGWSAIEQEGWRGPLYWTQQDGQWTAYGPQGREPLRLDDPVCHLSYYEACAYAAWAGARLPTEFEWEAWARKYVGEESPQAPYPNGLGEVWEWTASAYQPYPRFRPWDGSLAEYNGKFMVGQQVLRGASHATPKHSVRLSYRNFFPPHARWQFAGLRLALDL
ncbi:MAG: ergothioneine biosynthesis protein EgtB [Acidobacteriota bacterium]